MYTGRQEYAHTDASLVRDTGFICTAQYVGVDLGYQICQAINAVATRTMYTLKYVGCNLYIQYIGQAEKI